MDVCCECCVLSGRGLCDELIIRPEESYRLWCVVVCDLETSRIGAPYIYIYVYIYIYIYIYDISSLRVNSEDKTKIRQNFPSAQRRSSGMLYCVVGYIFTDVSKGRNAFIFRI